MEKFRTYGQAPYRTAVLHGGPGAAGEMAPVARELAGACGVLEPLQNETSVDGQVEELAAVLEENGVKPVTLVGWSWGAWLGFIFAARHPSVVEKLILVGSGPFEKRYAADIMKTRLERLTDSERAEVQSIMDAFHDPASGDRDALIARFGSLLSRADSYDTLDIDSEAAEVRSDIFKSVWDEAEELRRSGALLELGKSIRCPVVAIHGDYDPHPHEGVEKPLASVLQDFRFILLEKCGHTPWIERAVRERFFDILRNEIR